jgi:uncharacterized protein (DUF1786 family)
MKILTVDIGTGTQDILLYDSRLDIENGFKLVLPSPTMMVHRRIKAAAHSRTPILLLGRQMGGGPSAWAARDHARLGIPVYATKQAALTIDDDLERVQAMGIQVISEDETRRLAPDVQHLEMRDFDFPAIARVFESFGVTLRGLDAVAVAVFDHGAAPPDVSDRQFRFDYLEARLREKNSLSAFAFPAADIPASMTRLQAVADSAQDVDVPLVVMDTAPAAVLGAVFDPAAAAPARKIIANVGNFHTLAFRLGPGGVEGLFEHHTGEIDLPKLESLLRALADGTLTHADVFNDMGHGALVRSQETLAFGKGDFDVVVTGPRRSMFHRTPEIEQREALRPYFAVPFGDMMLTGNIGLLAATADLLPGLAGPICASLAGSGGSGTPPWEIPA